MAREALTVIGAVVGGIYGGPAGAQLGMAIGGAIGGLVDPEVIKVPSVRDAAQQTVNEGSPIALYDGTCGGAGTMVYCSEPRFITVRTRQGKGKGGPVVESERGLITYAILIGSALQDGPGVRNGIKNLIRVWEDEKLVYDVSPTSQILEESAAYAAGFTYYPGDELQLPDPDLEALLGATNCVAYRGRAMFVRKDYDATDRRLTPPVHKFEVATASELFADVQLVTDTRHYSGSRDALQVAASSIGWTGGSPYIRAAPNGIYAASAVPQAVSSARFTIRKFNPATQSWSEVAPPDIIPPLGPFAMAWSPDSQYLAITWDEPSDTEYLYIYKRVGDTFTKLPPSAEPLLDFPKNGRKAMTWDSAGARLAVCTANTGTQQVYVWDFVGEALVNRRRASGLSNASVECIDFLPELGGRYIAGSCGAFASGVVVFRDEGNALPLAAQLNNLGGVRGVWWDSTFGYLICVDGTSVAVVRFSSSVIGTEQLALEFIAADALPAVALDSAISPDRRHLAVAVNAQTSPSIYAWGAGTPPNPQALALPPSSGASIGSVDWANRPGIEQISAGATSFNAVTLAAARRCGMADSDFNLAEMNGTQVRGVVVASQAYTGQDLVNGLRATFPSDGSCFDGQVHILKRGGAVDFELDDEFRVEEGSDGEQDEVLRNGDDERKSPLRRPAKINVMFPNANLGYTFTKANAPNYGAPEGVVSEVTIEVPVVLDEETEAPQVADILDKISRAEADGELVRMFPDYLAAKAVPGTIIRLTDGGLQRRLRVQGLRNYDGTRRLSLWIDRQHTYTSQATAPATPGWPTPPPSLPGDTVAAFFNLPALVDEHDMLGIYAAISGNPGTAWHGAKIEYRVQGMTAWSDLGTFTQRATMGTLLAGLPAGSQVYPDATNPLVVRLLQDDDLESLTYVEWLSERGALAIRRENGTAEILQPRYAVNDTAQDWTLREHQRGRLNTSAAAHAAGARVVVLDTCLFLPLPSSVIGQTLEFRVTALGSTPEAAPIHTLTWNPVLVQQEFPVAYLEGTRAGGTIACTWIERRRFGTDVVPVRSLNWEGYRVTLTDGTTSETFDTTDASFSRSDAAFSGPITVTVQQLNRYTGPGPSTSLEIA